MATPPFNPRDQLFYRRFIYVIASSVRQNIASVVMLLLLSSGGCEGLLGCEPGPVVVEECDVVDVSVFEA